ncbi:MAG: NAD-dependent epimerase/dehydratase family protein [Actinobacteria bacterium]|nr:NAD-dependent epimerase/dehydratase family protein [Actinomycetota bacterium]
MSDIDAGDLSRGRVLVTGATGFLGASLVQRLVRDGVCVRALVRSREKASQLAADGVEVVVGDIADERAVASAVDGVEVVFHLAGKLYDPWEPEHEYRATHVEGTKRLLEHARRSRHLVRFVHCSTTGVFGATGAQPVAENAPFRPTNVYEATKAESELEVRAAGEDGFPAVVVRPGLVYGPGDVHLAGFFRSVLKRQFRPIGRAPVWLHPIYIDDMTDAFVRCAVRPEAVGECFNIAGPEPVSLKSLATAIAEANGTAPPAGHIPLFAARALAVAGDALPARWQRAAPLTSSRLDFLTHSRVYLVDKARRCLDFVAPTDLTIGVKNTLAWYREHGHVPA